MQKLRQAHLEYNAPSTLRLGRSTVIHLALSAQEPVRELKKRITELGERRGADIKVSDKMEAHLAGTGFKIEALTKELQGVGGQTVTDWRWEIEPTKTGTLQLHLTLTAFLHVKGEGTTPVSIRTFDTTMKIRVPLIDRTRSFVSHNWQWLWAVIVAPLAGLIVRHRRGRASEEE